MPAFFQIHVHIFSSITANKKSFKLKNLLDTKGTCFFPLHHFGDTNRSHKCQKTFFCTSNLAYKQRQLDKKFPINPRPTQLKINLLTRCKLWTNRYFNENFTSINWNDYYTFIMYKCLRFSIAFPLPPARMSPDSYCRVVVRKAI